MFLYKLLFNCLDRPNLLKINQLWKTKYCLRLFNFADYCLEMT